MKLKQALNDAQRRLAQAGVDTPEFDARALAAHLLDVPLSQLTMQQMRLLTGEEMAAYETLLVRRCRRQPLQYIVGSTEFYGYELICDPRALIPRADTEALVDLSLELIDELELTRLADIGTGTGAIALALALERPNLQVLATDTSGAALELAEDNVALHGLADRVALARGPWLEPLHDTRWAGTVEMIVSNPPYVRERDFPGLMAEIREHEPREALIDTAADGMGAHRTIVEQCRLLPALRAVALEVGEGQATEVAKLMRNALRAREVIIRKDLGSIDRAVAGVLGIGER